MKNNGKWFEKTIDSMQGHIEVLNKEMGEIRDCIADFKTENATAHGEMKTDISWIKKGFWALFVPIILLLIKAGLDFLTKF